MFAEYGLISIMTGRDRSHQVTRRRIRRRRMMLDNEIDLYCNPFVEVYLRLSNYTKKLTRRYLARLTGVAFVLQDNLLWRNVLAVATLTIC